MKYIKKYYEFVDSSATLGNTPGMSVVNVSVMTNGNNFHTNYGSADKIEVLTFDKKDKKKKSYKINHSDEDDEDEDDDV